MPQSKLARVAPPTAARAAHDPSPAPRELHRRALERRPVAPAMADVRRWPVAVFLATLALVNLVGSPYYALDRGARARHPWHDLLKPSGSVGQVAGLLALCIFLFLWLYPLRKRWKSLAWTGSVGKWLDVHVAAAIGLPLLLTAHAAWRSQGLIGLGFDAMLVVCASGVIGRYLYARIPRTRAGVELSLDEVTREREQLVSRIAASTGLPPAAIASSLDIAPGDSARPSLLRAFCHLVLGDYRRWRLTTDLPRRWAQLGGQGHVIDRARVREAVRLASREIALTQQVQMLEATHRIFRFWHVAHRPFAITALIAVVVHIVVVVAVGATWFY
jgi:hypothetical protein